MAELQHDNKPLWRTADKLVEQRGVGAVQDDQHQAPQQHVDLRRVAQRRPRALQQPERRLQGDGHIRVGSDCSDS